MLCIQDDREKNQFQKIKIKHLLSCLLVKGFMMYSVQGKPGKSRALSFMNLLFFCSLIENNQRTKRQMRRRRVSRNGQYNMRRSDTEKEKMLAFLRHRRSDHEKRGKYSLVH